MPGNEMSSIRVENFKRANALTTVTAAAPAGGTGAAAGAYDTAANRDTAIALINNCSTRITEIETILKNLGFLT